MERNHRTRQKILVLLKGSKKTGNIFLTVLRIQNWEYNNKLCMEINLRLSKFLPVFDSLYLIELA